MWDAGLMGGGKSNQVVGAQRAEGGPPVLDHRGTDAGGREHQAHALPGEVDSRPGHVIP